jgi:hypothetical protein
MHVYLTVDRERRENLAGDFRADVDHLIVEDPVSGVTRIENIKEQFRCFLASGGITEDHIGRVLSAIGEKVIESVCLYGVDSSGLRVIEFELRVDWTGDVEPAPGTPTISGRLPGWDGTQAPEVSAAGDRFAETVEGLGLSIGWTITLVPRVQNNPALNTKWRRKLRISGSPPAWQNPPEERSGGFADINDTTIIMRHAGD